MTYALVFPGQGAQEVGMGRGFYDACPAARRVFDEVDEALGESLSALIWEGDADTLTLTQNAQPALMATSIAAFRAMEAEGLSIANADFVAGHSLGEYSALCAAGSLTLADTAHLLRLRGQAMQEAVPVGVGAMAAILGLDFETDDRICREIGGDEVCQAANDNDPAQVVVSGHWRRRVHTPEKSAFGLNRLGHAPPGRAPAHIFFGQGFACRHVQAGLAHKQRNLHAAKKRLLHKGVGPLQQFAAHEVQFLGQHGVLCPDEQQILVVAQRTCQHAKIRPHNHAPVFPKMGKAVADLSLPRVHAKPGQNRRKHIARGYRLGILVFFTKHPGIHTQKPVITVLYG